MVLLNTINTKLPYFPTEIQQWVTDTERQSVLTLQAEQHMGTEIERMDVVGEDSKLLSSSDWIFRTFIAKLSFTLI